MIKIRTFNNIASQGLDLFPLDRYEISDTESAPDAVLLRSFNLHDHEVSENLKAIARAGAGVNNIPIDAMTKRGIPVFNTPGANANAVKELVLSAMLLASRNICQSWHYVRSLSSEGDELQQEVEKGKKQFAGFELAGRKLGVIGLGAIGVKVANMGLALGMDVVGYDPNLSVFRAWELSSSAKKAISIEKLLSTSDFISFHVPLLPDTEKLLNGERLKLLKQNAVVLNFSRGEIIDEEAMLEALNQGQKFTYVSDFPIQSLLQHPQVISLPHLGASTKEAEQNCAVMAVKQIRDYMEHGIIRNSVNFPEAIMPEVTGFRVGIVNANVPNMVAQIGAALASESLNIVDLLNKSREEVAYTLIDVKEKPSPSLLDKIKTIKGILSVRLIHG